MDSRTGAPPTLPSPAVDDEKRPSVWPHRLSSALFVMVCLELGMVLMLLPWTTLWSSNSLLEGHILLRRFLLDYFVRGAISGVGLLDLFVGVWEAVHYRDPK